MNKSIIKTVLVLAAYLLICNEKNYSQTDAVDINAINIAVQNIPEHNIETAPIKFQIEKAGNVIISVYNSKGEKIETIVDGEMEAGEYAVFFKTYERLESGEYYYTIVINGITELRNAIILK